MLTHEQICEAVSKVAVNYPINKVSYFGSYADGSMTEESDLDILVEFKETPVSLFKIIGIKHDLEDLLCIPVDVVRTPIPKKSLLDINKVIQVYG